MMSQNLLKPRRDEAAPGSICFRLVVSNDSAAPIYDLFVEQIGMVGLSAAPQQRLSNESRHLRRTDHLMSEGMLTVSHLRTCEDCAEILGRFCRRYREYA
jgi:hypothetical protein